MSHVDEYAEEVKERWGNSNAYRQSQARTSRYTHADFEAAKKDQEAVTELFVNAFGNKLATNSSEAQQAVVAHRAAITKWFYDCSIDMQKNLAVMYIEDPRFKAYYESRVHGLAQYVHDCIICQPSD